MQTLDSQEKLVILVVYGFVFCYISLGSILVIYYRKRKRISAIFPWVKFALAIAYLLFGLNNWLPAFVNYPCVIQLFVAFEFIAILGTAYFSEVSRLYVSFAIVKEAFKEVPVLIHTASTPSIPAILDEKTGFSIDVWIYEKFRVIRRSSTFVRAFLVAILLPLVIPFILLATVPVYHQDPWNFCDPTGPEIISIVVLAMFYMIPLVAFLIRLRHSPDIYDVKKRLYGNIASWVLITIIGLSITASGSVLAFYIFSFSIYVLPFSVSTVYPLVASFFDKEDTSSPHVSEMEGNSISYRLSSENILTRSKSSESAATETKKFVDLAHFLSDSDEMAMKSFGFFLCYSESELSSYRGCDTEEQKNELLIRAFNTLTFVIEFERSVRRTKDEDLISLASLNSMTLENEKKTLRKLSDNFCYNNFFPGSCVLLYQKNMDRETMKPFVPPYPCLMEENEIDNLYTLYKDYTSEDDTPKNPIKFCGAFVMLRNHAIEKLRPFFKRYLRSKQFQEFASRHVAFRTALKFRV